MKKYLMTGMAALAICAAFTSCSKETNVYNPEQPKQDIQATYEQNFIKVFGQPAANQDWGFGSVAKTRTADPRGNMWAAEGWNVPPVLTDAQKDIVRQYFQQNPKPQYNDPGWTDFWIQQVYDGGSNTEGSLSTESYLSANGGNVIGGEHMDHLCSKAEDGTEDHVNDFNNADNNDWGGRMLMRNSSTYSFGYLVSESSVYHYDKTGLVGWRKIAEWAVEKGLESSVETSVLNDGWNRSYMGFDYEQLDEKDVYVKNNDGSIKYATYAGPANPQYIWDGENVTKVFEQVNWVNVPIEGYEYMMYNNKAVPVVSMNANQFNGTHIGVSEDNLKIYKPNADGETVLCLNMEYIIENLLSKGYLPQDNGTNKDWVKVCPAADGIYSDWIVSLTEAEQIDTDWDIRIIGEDLSAGEDGNDFDFNDIVFDVKFTGDNTATIQIVAAGGTLPLKVAGREVHGLFEQGTNIMINTNAAAAGYPNQAYEQRDNLPTFDITLTGVKAANGKNIKIEVEKEVNGVKQWVELKANNGEPAAKIGVKPGFGYCNERQGISSKYPLFTQWVQNVDVVWYEKDAE